MPNVEQTSNSRNKKYETVFDRLTNPVRQASRSPSINTKRTQKKMPAKSPKRDIYNGAEAAFKTMP